MKVDTPSSVELLLLLMDVVVTTLLLAAAAIAVANRLDDNEADDIVVVDEALAFSNRVGGGVIETVGPDDVGGVVLFEP